MIILYDYWRSTASYRVRIALALAGLEWKSVPVDLVEGEQTSADHLKRNPQGLVPVLDIDGLRLTQSMAILDYLNETRSMNLLPQAPAERAKVRAIANAIAMEIHPVCNLRVAKYASSHSNGGISMKSWMQAHIEPGLAAVEQLMQGDGHCYGKEISLADLCLIPQLYNAHRWEVDLSKMPKIQSVERNLEAHPAFVAAHPDNSPR